MSSSSEVNSPDEREDRYSRNLAAMVELRAKIELTTRTLEMLVSELNSKHAQLEADAQEVVLFVRLLANARANEKLRQKRKAIAQKWIATGATAKRKAKATAWAKAKARPRKRFEGFA